MGLRNSCYGYENIAKIRPRKRHVQHVGMIINAHNIVVGNWKKEVTGKHL